MIGIPTAILVEMCILVLCVPALAFTGIRAKRRLKGKIEGLEKEVADLESIVRGIGK